MLEAITPDCWLKEAFELKAHWEFASGAENIGPVFEPTPEKLLANGTPAGIRGGAFDINGFMTPEGGKGNPPLLIWPFGNQLLFGIWLVPVIGLGKGVEFNWSDAKCCGSCNSIK